MRRSTYLISMGVLALVFGAGLVACSNADLSAGGAKAVGAKGNDGDEDEEDEGEPDAGEEEGTVPPGADSPEWVNGVSLTCEWLAAPAADKAQIGCNLRNAAGEKVKNTTKIGIEWAVFDANGNKLEAEGEDRDDGVTHVFTVPSKDVTKLSVGFKIATAKAGADGAPAPVKAKLAEKLPGLTYGSALSGCLEVGEKTAGECLKEQLAPAAANTAAASKNVRIFVSSRQYPGTFAPLANAHRECNSMAANGKLGGVWRAFVSAPNARYEANTTQGPVEVRSLVSAEAHVFDVSGTMVAASAADLFDGTLAAAITKNEKGDPVPQGTAVWTGSTVSGALAEQTCNNWAGGQLIGVVGSVGALSGEWLAKSPVPCPQQAHLYCIETPQFTTDAELLGTKSEGFP